jgi:hypothetical protein
MDENGPNSFIFSAGTASKYVEKSYIDFRCVTCERQLLLVESEAIAGPRDRRHVDA